MEDVLPKHQDHVILAKVIVRGPGPKSGLNWEQFGRSFETEVPVSGYDGWLPPVGVGSLFREAHANPVARSFNRLQRMESMYHDIESRQRSRCQV